MPTLGGGGAERVHINLAPALMERGFDVTFLLNRPSGSLVQAVPPGVRVVSLECDRTLAAFRPLVGFLKKEQPDVLISNLGHTNVMALWAAVAARVRTRVVVTQHSGLSAESGGRSWQFALLPLLYRMFLRRADGIVAVSDGVADDLSKVTGVDRRRIIRIHNPVIGPDFDRRMEEPPSHPWLASGRPPVVLAVGRFSREKGFDALVSAFAIVARKRDVRLILLGDGPLRQAIAARAKELGVWDRVAMPGFQENPLPFMRHAAVLVSASLYEGFGNVLVEALACGTPVVSTDCPHGPAEILDRGRFGRLVPVGDEDALASAILDTIDHPPSRDMLQRRGRAFTADRAAIWYADLIYRIVFPETEYDPLHDPEWRYR